MKILHLNTADMAGGAARAVFRLNRGLRQSGVDSNMLVQFKYSDDHAIIGRTLNIEKGLARIRITLDHLPKLLYPQKKTRQFHLQWLPDRIIKKALKYNPDIIHLHWICRGFINLKSLAKINIPVVWTLHDMWPFTGGCHYSEGCQGFSESCGACPQLGSRKTRDLSSWTLHRKQNYFNLKNMSLIAPSRWMMKQAQRSTLFRATPIQHIPNGIDTHRFHPMNRDAARDLLDLSRHKSLILIGAMGGSKDDRKGLQFLGPSLRHFSKTDIGKHSELLALGSSAPENPPNFGMKVTYLGKLNDDISLALAYAAADLFIAPSTQDNLPNMVMEALACGTPCIAFNIGGMPDMIEHKKNGYLVRPFDTSDLENGLNFILGSKRRMLKMDSEARLKVEKNFDSAIIARKHVELYEHVLKLNSAPACEKLP